MTFLGPQHQAILLAGGAGSSLFPLNHTGLPLALLPVANQPLITYPLRVLEEAGITDVLVVTHTGCSWLYSMRFLPHAS